MTEENMSMDWVGGNDEDSEIYRENILDHYRRPHNFQPCDACSFSHKELNPICGDTVTIYATIRNGRVEDVSFQGKGCAISMASASMLTDEVKGKTLEEVKEMDKDKVLELLGIQLGVVRLKCGMLSLRTLLKGLEDWERQHENA